MEVRKSGKITFDIRLEEKDIESILTGMCTKPMRIENLNLWVQVSVAPYDEIELWNILLTEKEAKDLLRGKATKYTNFAHNLKIRAVKVQK